MNGKTLAAALVFAAATVFVGASTANAPPLGTEQFEEWYDNSGNLVGYVHWTCDGDREVWGSRNGHLVVTRRACGP